MPVDFVLIQPESPGNIGSVARVMKNFSFCNLVLVNPCPVTDETRGFAMHAWDVVKNARVVKEMDWRKYDLVVGTTGLKGRNKVSLSPEELGRKIGRGKTAVVFGRESSGLSKKELEKCDCICHVPTSEDYPIMNLSHSVSIVLYELSKASGLTEGSKQIAERKQLSTLQNLFKGVIEKLNYSEEKAKLVYACIKNVTGKSILSKNEASTLIGMFKKIKETLKS